MKNLCSLWSPKTTEVNVETAVNSAINKVFPDSVISAVILILMSAGEDKHKISLKAEYKEN